MCWQGASNGVEKFSIRGDGLTTATTAEAGGSALVAHATAGAGAYSGSVLVSQAGDTSANGARFYLLRALTDAGGSHAEMFSVRGDGLTTATTDQAGVSAFVATASGAAYAGTVMEVQTTGTAAGGGFRLLHVSRVLGRGVGFGGRIAAGESACGHCVLGAPC